MEGPSSPERLALARIGLERLRGRDHAVPLGSALSYAFKMNWKPKQTAVLENETNEVGRRQRRASFGRLVGPRDTGLPAPHYLAPRPAPLSRTHLAAPGAARPSAPAGRGCCPRTSALRRCSAAAGSGAPRRPPVAAPHRHGQPASGAEVLGGWCPSRGTSRSRAPRLRLRALRGQ